MATRKRKAKGESEGQPPPAEGDTVGPGHNGPVELTDEQRQALFFQHKKAYSAKLEAKKRADAELKNTCKLAKAELGKGAVSDIKLAIQLETDGGDAEFKERIEREMRVARWMGASAGTQFDMFDMSGVPADERAFDEGKRDGMEGKPQSAAYHPGTPQLNKYIEGWNAGQAAIFNIQKKEDAELFEEVDETAEASAAAAPDAIGDTDASFRTAH